MTRVARQVNIEVDVLLDGIDFHTRVSRARFEDLCSSLFLDTLEPVKRALEDAKLTKEVQYGGALQMSLLARLARV